MAFAALELFIMYNCYIYIERLWSFIFQENYVNIICSVGYFKNNPLIFYLETFIIYL